MATGQNAIYTARFGRSAKSSEDRTAPPEQGVPVIASLLWSLAAAAVVVQIAVFGTTIYLHRAAAHRAVTLHPVVSWVFRMAIWLTTGIVPREWVAVHRKHHAFTDEEGDPHSPRLEGFWKIQLGNVFYYIRETRNRETMEKYAKDMKPDFWDRALFDRGNAGLLVGTAILCAVLGIGWGLLAAGIHAFTYIFLLSSSINGLRDIPFGLIYGTIVFLALIAVRILPLGTLLPACPFRSMTGVPCPTCGTTRLLMHLAQGDLSIAFCLTPVVAVILISAIVLFLHDVIVLFSGSRVVVSLSSRDSQWIRSGAIAALLVNWVYLAVYL